MSKKKESLVNRCTDKLFGGLRMSWLAVILFAIGTAVLTSVFLIVPVFKDTSFERMGVTFESWIFFAILIMANSKNPLESAIKTFVFFLISQPLIYLIQVPFSWMGWELFKFYKNWFIWTVLTFPLAFAGWYITKKNWLSLLIFTPVLAFLGWTVYESSSSCIHHFPHLLITFLFCVLQIALYVFAFFPNLGEKLVGVLIPLVVIAIFALNTPQVDLKETEPLPGNPSFSEETTVVVKDCSVCEVQLHSPEEGIVYIYAHQYGTTEVSMIDGEKELNYSVEVYDDNGIDRIRIMTVDS